MLRLWLIRNQDKNEIQASLLDVKLNLLNGGQRYTNFDLGAGAGKD